MRWESPIDGLASDQWRYFLFLAITVVMFVLIANIVRSRTGRSLVAIRDNEIAAEASGIHVSRVKILTFGTSAAIAGIGGRCWRSTTDGSTRPASACWCRSTCWWPWWWGGAATIIGPAVGTVVAGLFNNVIAPELPGRFENAAPVILGVLLIAQMLLAPNGIVGQLRELQAKFAARRAERTPQVHNDDVRTDDVRHGEDTGTGGSGATSDSVGST
ncbi:MAG: branched-chain amino acid ABC transporter permease [Microthrixaceae bacterium]|nr:branched-chain amino acid ABC transporter permease [Microthrixaceae bacterium]